MNNFFSIEDVLNATKGTLLSTVSNKFISVGTDTRSSLKDQLFIALQGESHDAHEYLDQAVKAGASGLMIQRLDPRFYQLKSKITLFLVPDTLKGLQQLGLYRRRDWGKEVIALTGSNGKTTTKEFIAQIISPYKSVHYNKGSFNNHWGLPLTLLGLQNEHDIAICEMGMNHAGEINSLVQLAEPNIVGVTTVGRAHLEGLGSIEAVASAKAEIYQFNNLNNSIHKKIFNLDNPWTKSMYDTITTKDKESSLTFSSKYKQCDVSLNINKMSLDWIDITGQINGNGGKARVPIFGIQNIENLMFASCAALAIGLNSEQIWNSLPKCKTIWGRNQKIYHSSGAEFIFDGYNANPDSQKALIENLKRIELKRPLIGVFGEMKELGAQSSKLHEELGELVSTAPFQTVFFVGSQSLHFRSGFEKNVPTQKNFPAHGLIHDSKSKLFIFNEVCDELIVEIKKFLDSKPLITIKGSRSMKLESIIESLGLTSHLLSF